MKDIDSLPAGRELDRMIFDAFFAPNIYESARSFGFGGGYPGEPEIPSYSGSDAAALEVLEKLDAPQVMLWRNGLASGWQARIAWDLEERAGVAEAPTLALAICRASLKAVRPPSSSGS